MTTWKRETVAGNHNGGCVGRQGEIGDEEEQSIAVGGCSGGRDRGCWRW